MKKGFTLIELVIVIVILGIVAAITSGIIANTFTTSRYVTSLNKTNLKVELALNEITNRLDYAIINTVVKRNPTTNSLNPIDLAEENDTVLEWIGYDIDGFDSVIDLNSTWSGFCDLNASSGSDINQTISTPGSNLNRARTIINRLSEGNVSSLKKGAALFFPGNYDYNSVGYIIGTSTTGDNSGVSLITDTTPINSTIDIKNQSKRITQKYKLAWSAYAVEPKNFKTVDGVDIYDLVLHYNFRPWMGEDYKNIRHSESVLVTGVTVFKTYATQNRVHIKLCIIDKYSFKKSTSICKEKVIYR